MEKEHSKYNLRWRNTIVESVCWPDSLDDEIGKMTFRFVIDEERHFYSSPLSFEFVFDLDSSTDIQFIKMTMDRYMVKELRAMRLGHQTGSKELILDYVLDIFSNPYEWNVSY